MVQNTNWRESKRRREVIVEDEIPVGSREGWGAATARTGYRWRVGSDCDHAMASCKCRAIETVLTLWPMTWEAQWLVVYRLYLPAR